MQGREKEMAPIEFHERYINTISARSFKFAVKESLKVFLLQGYYYNSSPCL